MSYGGSFDYPVSTQIPPGPASDKPDTSNQIAEINHAVSPAPVTHISRVRREIRNIPYTDSIIKSKPGNLPVEPHTEIGFWLSLGGAIAVIGLPFLALFAIDNFDFELLFAFLFAGSILATLALVAGLILGAKGSNIIKANPGKYSGRDLANAAITLSVLMLVLSAVSLFIYLMLYLIFSSF